MSETPLAPAGYTAVLVFDDKTPNTIILKRIVEHSFSLPQYMDLKPEEANDSIELILPPAREMLSVWNHFQAYQKEVGLSSWKVMTKEYADSVIEKHNAKPL